MMKRTITQTLVILTSQTGALGRVEQFLTNRGWVIFTTSDEKTALSAVVDRRPSFFLVSVEHNNPKVRSLHKLLKQTYPELCVILFAETNNITTYRLLTQSDHQHRIHPPLTGPAVERAVNRYLKEQRQREQEAEFYERNLRQQFPDQVITGVSWQSTEVVDTVNLLSLGIDKVIGEILETGPEGVAPQKFVGPISNTACIVIESPMFSGYLIAAMAGNRPFEDEFVALIKMRLVRFLRERGHSVKEGESFPMTIKEVVFESWANDYAEFLKKAVHKGEEMAFAFFPMADVAPLIRESSRKDMTSFSLDEIRADEPVDFNVYMYMAANQRMLLYTPKGAIFYAAQKDRLKKSGVTELLIRDSELKDLKRYRARHKIETLVSEFNDRT